jgi:hypothetical protein
MGEDNLGPKPAGISDSELEEAKRLTKKLSEPHGGILPNTETVSREADRTVIDTIETLNSAVPIVGQMAKELKEAELGTDGRYLSGPYKGYTPGEAQEIIALSYSAATGGDIWSSGPAVVHEGETIVPADISRSSPLIDRLRAVSTGNNGVGKVADKIEVNISLSGPQDANRITQNIREALERELSSFTFGQRVEEYVRRADRAYIA